jgi:Fe-S cluster biogenesis protein NfuA
LNGVISTAASPPELSTRPVDAAETPSSRLRAPVEKIIEVIRPALKADGGDIVLHDVDDETGVVTVELIGACVGCPASSQTMKAGIERIMRDRVDGVTAVVNLSDPAE